MTKVRNRNKKKFLREVEENPIVERACRKIGIARSTFYRWCAEDGEFEVAAEIARDRGREKVNDLAEAKLIENILANMQQAIAYWLSNNSKQYQRPTTILHYRENERLSSMLKSQQDVIDWLTNIIGEKRVVEMLGEGSLDTYLQRAKKDKRLKDEMS